MNKDFVSEQTTYEGATLVITHRVCNDKHVDYENGWMKSLRFVKLLRDIWTGTSSVRFQD